MNLVPAIILSFSCAYAYINSEEFINEINSKQNLWIAGRNFHKDTPMSRLQGLVGAKKLPAHLFKTIPVKKHEIVDEIPESFDARTQWSKCEMIKKIQDQSACGSCWAVSTSTAISDRICIHSKGELQPQISAKNLMSCDKFSYGCDGGFPDQAWEYWENNGLVTGGPYGSKIGCQPYPFAECEHVIDGPKPKCSSTYKTPECVKRCDNPRMNFKRNLFYGATTYAVDGNETQFQLEILKNGPVVVLFMVYSDFLHYKSGVYTNTTNETVGLHAVRMIGWGVQNGTKYWLIANSWNEDWGDKGFFKIRRGTNECTIGQEGIVVGLPKIDNA